MKTTDTTENGFERGNLYGTGEYNRVYAVDEVRLFRFLEKRQAETVEVLHINVSDLNLKTAVINGLRWTR